MYRSSMGVRFGICRKSIYMDSCHLEEYKEAEDRQIYCGIYKLQCKQCDKLYIGKMGRKFKTYM